MGNFQPPFETPIFQNFGKKSWNALFIIIIAVVYFYLNHLYLLNQDKLVLKATTGKYDETP